MEEDVSSGREERWVRRQWGSARDQVRGAVGEKEGERVSEQILIVDDDPMIRATIADILGMEGYDVETAANGQEGLSIIDQECPALILLDMRMPVLDGWEFAKALRKRQIKVPIIVMTAATNADAWAREINADDCLGKPFDLTDLLDRIARFLPPDPTRPSG